MNPSIDYEPNVQVHSNEAGVSEATLSVENVGKFARRAGTKLITWTFVDTSKNHREDQVPHTVALRWHKQSGKMEVTMDDAPVCSYKHKGQDIISHKWRTPDGMELLIVAARVTPNGVADNFQKYGLIVNGQEVPLMKSAEDGYDANKPAGFPSDGKSSSILQLLYPNGYEIDSKTEELLRVEWAPETERMLLV